MCLGTTGLPLSLFDSKLSLVVRMFAPLSIIYCKIWFSLALPITIWGIFVPWAAAFYFLACWSSFYYVSFFISVKRAESWSIGFLCVLKDLRVANMDESSFLDGELLLDIVSSLLTIYCLLALVRLEVFTGFKEMKASMSLLLRPVECFLSCSFFVDLILGETLFLYCCRVIGSCALAAC